MNFAERMSDIQACQSMEELHAVMTRIAGDYGFVSYNFLDTGDPLSMTPYYVGSIEEGWQNAYRDGDFAPIDPCLTLARRTSVSFKWTSIERPPYTTGRKPAVMRMFEATRDFRYTDGLVIPLHFRDQFARPCSALILMIWKDPVSKLTFMLKDHTNDLHMAAIYWVQQAVDLLRRRHRRGPVFHSDAPPPILTDRERMVLLFAARGKTAGETADILKISSRTVETHAQSAIAKLRASTKTHATALALAYGLIEL